MHSLTVSTDGNGQAAFSANLEQEVTSLGITATATDLDANTSELSPCRALEPYVAPDRDLDEILDQQDNCPDVYNPDQANQDGDSRGDLCDFCPGGDDETPECINRVGAALSGSGGGFASSSGGCALNGDKQIKTSFSFMLWAFLFGMILFRKTFYLIKT